MKNKVESLQGYDLIEANDDVIKLLNGFKEPTLKMHEMQYGYWTICQTAAAVTVATTVLDGVASMMVSHYSKK
jgi:hypothetical protein